MLTKGIQAVYLAAWSDKSVSNLLTVLKEDTTGRFEIGFTPNDFHSSKGIYENARTIAVELAKVGKPLTLTIHLGFHLKGSAIVGSPLYNDLKARAAKLDGFLNQVVNVNGKSYRIIDLPKLQINVSPALEDNFKKQAEFDLAVQAIADGLSESVIRAIRFRWINVVSNSAANVDNPAVTTINVKTTTRDASGRAKAVVIARPLDHEYHGEIVNASGYQVFSNDGGFVRSNGDLDRDGKTDEAVTASRNPDAMRNPNYLTLDDFVNGYKRKANRPGTILLWRPAYNLHKLGKPTSAYDVPSYDPTADRVDSASVPFFGKLEMAVLRRFLAL
jgi:hypothetical protein